MSNYDLTKARVLQWIGIIMVLLIVGGAYWYFGVRAGVKTNTGGTQPEGTGDLSAGLALYWKFDDGSGSSAADASVNGSTGTLYGSPTWTAGQIGGGLSFDGTTAQRVSSSVTVLTDANIPSGFSGAMWLKHGGTGSSDYAWEIGGSGAFTFNKGNNGDIGCYVRDATTGFYNTNGTTVNINNGVFNHIACVYAPGSNTLTLYVNGVSRASVSTVGFTSLMNNGGTLNVGGRQYGTDSINGSIDEVRVYNRTLSVDEVARLYRLTAPTGVDTGLKGYWSFDGEALSGTTTFDRSGAGNNGTLTNGPTVARGKLGQALNFDGTNDTVTVSGFNQTVTAATFTAWVNLDTIDVFDGIVFSRGTIATGMNVSGVGTLGYHWNDGQYNWNSGLTLPTSQWVFVAVSVTPTQATAYLSSDSGGLVSAVNTASHGSVTLDALRIGRDLDNNSRQIDGRIDEVRVYSRALSASEIKSLYDSSQSDKANTSASQPQGTGRLDSGLALYWKFDDGSGSSAADGSTNGSTGTLYGSPTWTTGQIGGGLSFSGASAQSVRSSATVLTSADIPGGFSGTAWVKHNGSGSETEVWELGGSDSFALYKTSTGDLNCHLRDTTLGYFETIATTVNINNSAFNHVACVYAPGNNTFTLYVNGISRASVSTVGFSSLMNNGGTLNVGGRSYGTGSINGSIDEVRIYKRPLSGDEVAQLYRLTAPTGVDTGLKGYWSFNGSDLSGTTAFDRSGAGNNGTLTNGPTVARGKLGQALSFDGSAAYVALASSTSLPLYSSGTFSVSLWVKGSPQNGRIVFSEGHASSTNQILNAGCTVTSPYKKFRIFIRNDAGGGVQDAVSSTDVCDGSWHHITYTDINGTAKLYIDGVQDATNFSYTRSGTFTLSHTAIGLEWLGAILNAPFSGSIDEVRVYNRVLTAAEIKSLYDSSQSDKTNTSASQPQGTGRLDSGLAGYWKLDENTGTSAGDASTNSNTGTLTNGPTWTTGRIGSAVTFDGSNDYVTVPDNTSINFGAGQDFTVGAWVKSTQAAVSDTYPVIVSKEDGAATRQGYNLLLHNHTEAPWYFAVWVGGTVYEAPGASNVADGNWHHVVGMRKGSEIYLYQDGVLVNSSSASSGSVTKNIPLYLGDISGGAGCSTCKFSGSIDETRVYNRALSADEVAQLYRLTAPIGTDTSLKGYWSFNGQDVSGTTAFDRSGAGNNGTLTNGPTVGRGKIGQALNFDGTDDWVSMGTSSSLAITGEVSVTAWAKLGAVGIDQKIVIKAGSYKLGVYTNNKAEFEIAGGGGPAVNRAVAGGTVLTSGQWYHIVGIYSDSGDYVRTYVNGVLDRELTTAEVMSVPSSVFCIGVDACTGSQYWWNGALDEVRVYNRVLTATEIKSLYDQSR